MLTEVKRNLRFMCVCVKYNLAREMENRAAFIAQMSGMIANDAIVFVQWVILFSLTDTICGYGFTDMVLMWGLAASAFGFAHILFANVILLPSYITEGKLDAYLIQPKNALLNVACGRMSVPAAGDLIYGIVLAVIACRSIVSFLMFLFFTVTGGLILASFYTLSGCIAFRLKNSEDFSGALNNLMLNFGTYPEGLFDGTAKWLLFTLIPVGFSAYIPMRFFMGFEWKWVLAVAGFTVLITAAAFFVFHKGLKRYGSGNIMAARL